MTEPLTGAVLACAAVRFVGVPFRLHGRNPAVGLDCVGLLAAAMATAGRPAALPTGYSLRLSTLAPWLPSPASLGFEPVCGAPLPGDVVLLELPAAQFHVAIAAPEAGWVHAHAGLRRVVISPHLPPGRIDQHWRCRPDQP